MLNQTTTRCSHERRFNNIYYQFYEETYDRKDAMDIVADLREAGHKARFIKAQAYDDCFRVYVKWNNQ